MQTGPGLRLFMARTPSALRPRRRLAPGAAPTTAWRGACEGYVRYALAWLLARVMDHRQKAEGPVVHDVSARWRPPQRA